MDRKKLTAALATAVTLGGTAALVSPAQADACQDWMWTYAAGYATGACAQYGMVGTVGWCVDTPVNQEFYFSYSCHY